MATFANVPRKTARRIEHIPLHNILNHTLGPQIILSYFPLSYLVYHRLYTVQHCTHTSEKLKIKPSPHTPICFEELPQYAPRLARYDEIELFSMLQVCQEQLPAKSIELLSQNTQQISFYRTRNKD